MIVSDTRLTHLISVVRHGHFGLAAASLGISQPALSKSIQGLEAVLGVKVLDRERVVPTTFGETVIQYGTEILRTQNEMLRNLKSLNNLDAGLVKVQFGPYPIVISGHAAAARLLKHHPNIQLSLGVADWRECMAAVIDGSVEFGVAEQDELVTDTRFEFEVLGAHSGRLFCHPEHPLLCQPRITFEDVLQYPWASSRLPSRVSNRFPRQPCPAGHIDPLNGDFVPSVQIDVPINLGNFTAGREMLTLASLALVEKEVAAGIMVPLPGLIFESRYGLLRLKSHSFSPAALALIAEIRAVEAEFSQRELFLAKKYKNLITPRSA
ncbi:HTH-type transcriptional regulator GbpR [Halioglobus japonicus]|nr:HTH-type transcriptional regulator GbpR [Halioglobus japonicus]